MKLFEKFNLRKNSSIKKYEEIINMKDVLDEFSKDFADLLDRLSELQCDLDFLENICNEYQSKIKLAINKNNIHLAKKALTKHSMAYSDFLELKNLVYHLFNCKNEIYTLLKSLEIEYVSIITNYENNNESSLNSSIKKFSKLEYELNKEFSSINNVPEFIPPEIDLDKELKNYI